jgi:hypothetical protein
VALLFLWPAIALTSAITFAKIRRKEPAVYSGNQDHLAQLGTLRMLCGRTVIVEFERP